MKTIFFALGLAGLVLSSAVTAILGLFMMGNQLYAGTNNFLPGFEVFSLSTITFFVTVTAYIATRILESTSETLLKMIAFDMKEEAKKNMINNPLAALFGGMGMPGA